MIVTCDQCQTRFKIPDNKVTDRGVKVRCTKCQHTFRVARAAPPDPALSDAVSSTGDPFSMEDPFAQFGPTPDLAEHQETRPGFYATGVAATRSGPSMSPAALNPWGDTAESAGDLLNEPTAVRPGRLPLAPQPPPDTEWSDAPAFPLTPSDPSGGWGFDPAPPPVDLRGPPRASDALLGDIPLPAFDRSVQRPALSANVLFMQEDEAASVSNGPTFQADHALFDMPAPAPATERSGLLEDVPEADVELASSVFHPGPKMAPAPVLAPSGSGIAKPRRPADAASLRERKGGSWLRRIFELGVHLVVAAVLLMLVVAVGTVWLNEGRLDWTALSPKALAARLAPTATVVTRDVSNGLYETRAGKPIFFIRGDAENRTRGSVRVQVRAEIWDGAQLVGVARGVAGAAPTPEDLYALGSAKDIDALNARLAAEARPLTPGGRAPFLLTFETYPADLTGLKLKVLATQAP